MKIKKAPKPVQKKAPAPKKAPTGAGNPSKSSIPAKVGSKAKAGAAAVKKATYQVPKKLLKPTPKKKAPLPTLAEVLKKQDQRIAAFNAKKKAASQTKGTIGEVKKKAPVKKSSDWDKGLEAEKALAKKNAQLKKVSKIK